jgi:hypothetical protein
MNEMLVNKRTAAVPSSVKNGQRDRRYLAAMPKLRFKLLHRRIEATLIPCATIHVNRDALQSLQGTWNLLIRNQTYEATGNDDDPSTKLWPERGKA